MSYTNGLDKEQFLQHIYEAFPSVFENSFSREMLENIVNYGLSGNLPPSKDTLYYFLCDMIPEIEPNDILHYMDLRHLTNDVIGVHSVKKIHTLDELKNYLSTNGWQIESCNFANNGAGWEIGKHSPAGEDFFFAIEHNNDAKTAIEEIKNYAWTFDTNEHAKMWCTVQDSRLGIPDIETLVKDAKAIQAMLINLAGSLEYNKDTITAFASGNFIDDEEKMQDFTEMTKEDFLASYSYLTEDEYDNTLSLWQEQMQKRSLTKQITEAQNKSQKPAPQQQNKDHYI